MADVLGTDAINWAGHEREMAEAAPLHALMLRRVAELNEQDGKRTSEVKPPPLPPLPPLPPPPPRRAARDKSIATIPSPLLLRVAILRYSDKAIVILMSPPPPPPPPPPPLPLLLPPPGKAGGPAAGPTGHAGHRVGRLRGAL